MMPDFDLKFGGSPYILLLIPFMVAVAFLAYRRVNWSGSRAFRALFFLRISTLLMTLFLIVEPLFAFTYQSLHPPTVALLLDESASMKIADSTGERREVLRHILGDIKVHDRLSGIVDLRVFAFGESLRSAPSARFDDLKWDAPATNLGGAFMSLREIFKGQNLSAVFLITDGAANVGVDVEKAASDLGVPIYAVGVGDRSQPRDIAVVSASCDPISTVGQETPIRVTIRSFGYDKIRLPIEIREGGRLILAQQILIEDGEQQIDLPLKPEKPGLRIYEVRVSPQPHERSSGNNSSTFSQKALKGKKRILLVGGGPTPDFGYIRRLLLSDKTIEVDARLKGFQGGGSGEIENLKFLKSFDLVVLVNLASSKLAGVESALANFLRSGGGLLMVGGHNAFDPGFGASPLSDLIPVYAIPSRSSFHQDRFQLVFPDARHPILHLTDDPETDARTLAEMPPILGYNRTLGVRPGAKVLAVHPDKRIQDGARMPLIVVDVNLGGRVMAVPCATIFRLSALMWGIGKTSRTPDALWKNAFQWLMTPEESRRVRIVADRPVWKEGEPVTLRAFVTDALTRPQTGAVVNVSISGVSGIRTITLVESGHGRYVGQIRGLLPGEHRFEGTAVVERLMKTDGGVRSSKGREVGRDRGSITVSAAGLEFENLRMNEDLLRAICGSSQGAFLMPAQVDTFVANFNLPSKTISEIHRWRFWENPYTLALLVSLLAVEWAARRRRGML